MRRVVVSGKTLSEILDVSERYIKILAKDEFIVKIENNQYDLIESIKMYLKNYQKKDIDIDTNLITLKELSETLGIAERTVQDLASKEILRKANKGSYLFRESVEGYINYVKQNEGTQSESLKSKRAERELKEIKLLEKKKELHHVFIIKEQVEGMLIFFKQKIRAIPVKLAPQLARENDKNKIEALIKNILDKALDELSEYQEESTL